jgi:alkylhydroperoxidase/carboxymuconolactone decarboxylase family protein YurZ
MNIDIDNLEEIKELLEHALERHSWPAVEDALTILKEELGYEADELEEEEQ